MCNYINLIQFIKQNCMNSAINKTNLFAQNYLEFLEIGNDSIKSRKISQNNSRQDEFANDELNAADINMIMKKKFYKCQYPADILSANIYCPFCGKQIQQNQQISAYESEAFKRRFLAHEKCLASDTVRHLNDLFVSVQEMTLCSNQNISEDKMQFSLGQRQFCIQMSICHPLSDFKFLKLVTKRSLKMNKLKWQLRQEEVEQSSYEPNLIAIPYVDFKINLIISQIGSQQQKIVIQNYVNLSRMKISTLKSLTVKSQQISLRVGIHNTDIQKEQITTLMNYKYKYKHKKNMPIIQLQLIQIEIPQDQYKDDTYENNLTINQILTQKGEKSSQKSSINLYSNVSKNYNIYQQSPTGSRNDSINFINIENKPTQKVNSGQKEKVDFQKLMATGKLSAYVRNGTQSRIFQKFLSQATNDQIQLIINTLYDQFPDLVIDEYANYMAQKLFQRCTPGQRMHILAKLFPHIPNLVKNKQGTHTIQFFISYLTLPEQLQLIVQSINKQFDSLCFHSISTHFVQKIIKTFPLPIAISFYFHVQKNFLRFAIDKNAMCVLKYMLGKVKQQENRPQVIELKKHFINEITLNTHKIIQDCYGNYVIQFCYQLFGENRSSGITQMIIQKFVQFSLQRFSSSVVSKCINVYWNDKSYVNKLKQSLTSEGILQMYKNQKGNKILLDLMDKNQYTSLRKKIQTSVSKFQMTKFNHDRWGMQMGSRSGPNGFQYKSFSQAAGQMQKQKQTKDSKKPKKK